MKSQICRYCHAKFTPKANKPGYPDECADCIHIKTASDGSLKELAKSLKKLDRELEKVGDEIKRSRKSDDRKAKKRG
jgi:hypothetical protein